MKLKKALSGILAAAMVVSLTPAMAFATTTNTIAGVGTVSKSSEFTKKVELSVKGVMKNWQGYSTAAGSGTAATAAAKYDQYSALVDLYAGDGTAAVVSEGNVLSEDQANSVTTLYVYTRATADQVDGSNNATEELYDSEGAASVSVAEGTSLGSTDVTTLFTRRAATVGDLSDTGKDIAKVALYDADGIQVYSVGDVISGDVATYYTTTASMQYKEELTLKLDNAKWAFGVPGSKDSSSKLEAAQFQGSPNATKDPIFASVTDKNGKAHSTATAKVEYCSSNSVTLTIANAQTIIDGDIIQLTLNLKSGTTAGDITLSLSSNDGDISSLDSRVIATIVSGKTVATVPDYGTDDLEKLAVRTAGMATSDIQIKEVTNGCLGSTTQIFSLTLPSELSWATVSDTATVNGKTGDKANVSFGGSLYTPSVSNPVAIVDPTNDRVLLVSVTPNSTTNARRTLTITPKVNTSKDVKEGEVSVTLRGLGSSDITDTSDLVIATVGTSSISVFVDEEDFKEGKTPVLQSGISYKKESVSTNIKKNVVITLEENNKDSFTTGKWVDFTFDKKVQLAGDVTVQVDGVDRSASLDNNAKTTIDEERSSFGWQVAGIDPGKKNKVKVYIPITVEAGYEGDITCTVSGDAAGVTTSEVVVAKAAPVVTVSATPSDVRAGVKNQDIGDVVITETEIGALKDSIDTLNMPLADAAYYKGNKDNTYDAKKTTSELVVKFPFALKELPTVDVTDGDLDIKDVAWTTDTTDKKSITIEIKSESVKTASTITISGLKVTLDRTPAEGGYAIDVYGSAILQNAGFGKDKVFADAYSVKDAINVVTPADSTTVSEKVQAEFVIGEASYTNNGAATEMDAAPYIDSHNRTMVPIRYVANACGISENDIRWEQNTQTAIINGLNTVVTVKMGSNKLQTSTGEITMDTAAVNNNGRIYVPVRYIANALGANVSWDAATKTVTLTK